VPDTRGHDNVFLCSVNCITFRDKKKDPRRFEKENAPLNRVTEDGLSVHKFRGGGLGSDIRYVTSRDVSWFVFGLYM